jgi:glucose-1-phosphate thymidylyltransferase
LGEIARVSASAIRSVYVLAKGVVVVPNSIPRTGPWLSATRATALQRVANRPIVCHVLDALIEAGATEAAVVSPPDVASDVLDIAAAEGPPGIVLRPIVEDRRGPNDTLAAVQDFVGDDGCILHRADGLLGRPILAPLDDQHEQPDVLLHVQEGAPEVRRLRLVAGEGTTDDAEQGHGVAGACVLAPGALQLVRAPFPPMLDFGGVAARVQRAGGTMQAQVARKWRHFTGDPFDLLDMNRTLLDALTSEETPTPGDGNRFEGRIAIHPTAEVSSSVIVGPVLIGPEARISDSYIGPHTSIAERVRIEGTELERSIVLAGASVLHVGGRLVASIVGREARIFRDFSMPRALRLQVGDGDEVALC